VDEHESARLFGRRPEIAQAWVAEVCAVGDGRNLDAAETAVSHQSDELLGSLRVDRAEHEHALADKGRQGLVLALDLDSAEVDPGAEDDDVDAGPILFLEDPVDVLELADRRPSLTPVLPDHLDAVLPLGVGAEAGDDYVRMDVDDSVHSAESLAPAATTSTVVAAIVSSSGW
jgi:hypothetical protein